MALKFKNGDKVTQVMPAPITGEVTRFVFDDTTGEISYVVSSTDPDGTLHERVFSEADIQLAQ
jgi:hypothetical protein